MVAANIGRKRGIDLLIGGITLEVEVVKLQAQFGLAPDTNFEKNMLEIRFDGSHRDA